MGKRVITVQGKIEKTEMGLTLPHEHIMVDFIGADKTGKDRYDADDVIQVMLPYLQEIKELGVKTFIDCTPMYLARDVNILKRLSELTGLNIVTNTGQYKEPFLPAETYQLAPAEIADKWIKEFKQGIEGTRVVPGFIKTAVESGPLTEIEKKVIKAAVLTSLETGMTIATHCGDGQTASQILDIFEKYKLDPSQWIFVHAQNEVNYDLLVEIARRGAWLEFDGISSETTEKHLVPVLKLLKQGFQNQLLLSQDAGWYNVGEEHGGKQRSFAYLLESFIPQLKENGVSEQEINLLTKENPFEAFAIT